VQDVHVIVVMCIAVAVVGLWLSWNDCESAASW
jgi:hypothetical protein